MVDLSILKYLMTRKYSQYIICKAYEPICKYMHRHIHRCTLEVCTPNMGYLIVLPSVYLYFVSFLK